MEHKLSRRQHQVLSFIAEQVSKRGYPPSVREICKAVGLASSSTAHGHLARLEQNGFIQRDPTKPRAIMLTDKAKALFPHSFTASTTDQQKVMNMRREPIYVEVPVVGDVTAGLPILAVEHWEETLALPKQWVGRDDVFVLKIKGDSMIEAGIWDGDMVVVRKQEDAIDGDIVVALLEDEATVKRFYREKDRIRLQPENPSHEPIYAEQVTILGKVIGLYREF